MRAFKWLSYLLLIRWLVIHHGSYNSSSQAYATVLGWIKANGYSVIGASREIYIVGGAEQDNDSYVTEVQFPVEKSKVVTGAEYYFMRV